MQVSKTDLKAENGGSRNAEPNLVNATAERPIVSGAPGRRRTRLAKGRGAAREANSSQVAHPSCTPVPSANGTSPVLESCASDQMNLRQKLGEVRRRIGYIQKRGYNERHDYNYVAAADIAGAVGDVLAELGVVVIPRLESITYEPHTPGRADSVRVARVIMAYTFTDETSGEEITARVAGEGLDMGDKASYKAMTGALKYALLQSFLLATGDDPEDERTDSRTPGVERLISAEQERELNGLIEETGTELERVLAYYKVSALSEMTEAS